MRNYRGHLLVELADGKGIFHGEDLVMALGTPRDGKPGLGDNVASAEKCLKAAEASNFIKRVKWQPTRQQLFFGVGGLGAPNRHNMAYRSATEFIWQKK